MMKTAVIIMLHCLLNFCVYENLSAQKNTTTDSLENFQIALINDARSEFPTLNVLIDSAVNHNALVAYRMQGIQVKNSNLVAQRNNWLRNMGVQADSRYGTFDNFSSNAASGQSTTLLAVTSKQFNYGAGVFIKMPLFDVLNRKNQIKQARAEVAEATYLAQSQKDELVQLVTKQYEELLLKQKLLVIKSQNFGTATVNREMVEKEFRNGIIPVTEYVRLSDMTARIQSDYEMAKSEFGLSKKILEEIVGFSFKNPVISEK